MPGALPQLRWNGLTWAVAGLLAVLVVVQSLLVWDRPGPLERVAFTAVPVAVLAIALSAAAGRYRWVMVGSLLLAVTPTALSALAAAGWEGAFAVLVACGAALVDRFPPRLGAIAAVAVAAVGFVLWVAATPGHGEFPAPSWREIWAGTGDVLRTSVGAVGESGWPIPASAMLGWWVAVGLVLGAAVTAGAWRRALAVPAAVAVLVLGAWVIARWRGPVAVGGGTWILSGAVAYVGGTRLAEPGAERRIGRCLIVVAAWVWFAAVVQQVRAVSSDPDDVQTLWNGGPLATTAVSPVALLAAALVAVAALAALLCLSGRPAASGP